MTAQKQNPLYRLVYRLAYPIVRRWWRLHGRHSGVGIAVWCGDTVLAVRHSYKPGLRLPGAASRGAKITTKQRFASFAKRSV